MSLVSWGNQRGAQDRTLMQDPSRIRDRPNGHMHSTGNFPPNQKDASLFRDERFAPYFGQARGVVPPREMGYEGQDEENFDLPDAYIGENATMRRIIITQVIQSEMWGTSVALPWKKKEGSHEIAWDTWTFNDTLPTRTPEEAVSRLLSSHKGGGSMSMHRLGIAFIIEHGFWSTEQGKQHYALQLLQIKNAIAEGAQMGVSFAILNPPEYISDDAKYIVATERNRTQLNNVFQAELDQFACVNKSPEEFAAAMGKAKKTFRGRNKTNFNLLVLPEGTRDMVQENMRASWSLLPQSSFNTDKFRQITGEDSMMVVESVGHKQGEHQEDVDPFYRTVVIGSFNQMLDLHLASVPLKDYMTCMRDIVIYSEDLDDFRRISFMSALKCTGVYSGWDTANNPGEMPLTNLGRKIMLMDSWGQVYEQVGKLDHFLAQMRGKDEHTYQDFVQKFMLRDAQPAEEQKEDDAEMQYPYENNAGDHVPDDMELEAEGGNDASTALLTQQAQSGEHSRIQVMFNWLQSLDEEAAKVGVSTNLLKQVTDTMKAKAADIERDNDAKTGAALLYELAWSKAKELIILYDLQIALKLNKPHLTEFESYVANSSQLKSFSGLSEEDAKQLAKAEHKSPFWYPTTHSNESEVELVAPEPGAGDRNRSTKTLEFASHAFTLASQFLVLFHVNSNTVQDMVDAAELEKRLSAPGTTHDQRRKLPKFLFDINLNWPDNMPQRQALRERAGKLQFSIILSTLYATLVSTLRKSNRTAADYTALAAKWINLAKPVNMVTRSDESYKATLTEVSQMYTLDYQAPIDGLVMSLRDALIEISTALITESEGGAALDTEKVISLIREVELRVIDFQQNNHIRMIEAPQADTGALPSLGLDDPTLKSMVIFKDFMATFTHKVRKFKPSDVDKARRAENLKGAAKVLKGLLDKLHKTRPIAADRTDQSTHWKPTYVKLMEDLPKDAFANTYLPVNDDFINYAKPSLSDDMSVGWTRGAALVAGKPAEAAIDELFRDFAGDNSGGSEVRTAVKAAQEEFARKTHMVSPQAMALQWTLLWAAYPKQMIKIASELKGFTPEQQDLILHTTAYSAYVLQRRNHEILREQIKKQWSHLGGELTPNERYPMLFLNSRDGKKVSAAGASPSTFSESVVDGHKVQRLSDEVLRAHMMNDMPVTDGYFLKWCLINNIIVGLGVRLMKNAIRYEAGTAVGMSAWGAAGNTWYGHANMMLSDNAATKMHYGHLTWYEKAVVTDSRRIVHMRNIRVRAYLGGNGHLMWDAGNENDVEDYKAGLLNCDMFAVLIFSNEATDMNHIDLTGRYHKVLGASEDAQKGTAYASSAVYNEHWGWTNALQDLENDEYGHRTGNSDNTVLFQAHQFDYDHATGKMDLATTDKGHWGDRVYRGCGKVRRGAGGYLQPVSYSGTNVIGITR